MDAVREAVAAAWEQASGPLYVGFSGGLDSMVLLHAAAGERRGRALRAVHVDHGLHPRSGDWCRHCESVCADLGVELVARRAAVASGGSLEARAREARYRVFAEVLSGGGTLLLAHHRDDQAETVLLRLLQGRGLYGMPQWRPLAAGRVARPLLHLPRAVLATYAHEQGLSWLEDPANRDPDLDRNYLRRTVLPVVRDRWPDVDAALVAAMSRQQLADRLLAAELGGAGRATLPVDVLRARPAVEQAELLRLWLAAHDVPAPARGGLTEFVRQLDAGADRHPELRVHGAVLRRYRGDVHLVRPRPALAARYPVALPGVSRLPHGELRIEADAAGFRPVGAVAVRFRTGGERLRCGGRERSVKHLFQAGGVPPWQRESHPLLYDDRGLLAVPGLACRDVESGAESAPRFCVRWTPD
ncbi:MAG: tRNA lysidine(34) synthetase TilS [Pseudomonadota bacterium]